MQTPRTLTQTGTQTSPESTNGVSLKGHFSIGSTSKEEKVSPKLSRKERGSGKIRPKRAISPTKMQQLPSTSKVYPGTETVKTAISPSVAESLRAVFAAFLWHEGGVISYETANVFCIFCNGIFCFVLLFCSSVFFFISYCVVIQQYRWFFINGKLGTFQV